MCFSQASSTRKPGLLQLWSEKPLRAVERYPASQSAKNDCVLSHKWDIFINNPTITMFRDYYERRGNTRRWKWVLFKKKKKNKLSSGDGMMITIMTSQHLWSPIQNILSQNSMHICIAVTGFSRISKNNMKLGKAY